MRYGIISISDEREETKGQIRHSFDCDPEPLRCFDISNRADVMRFINTFPGFDLNQYNANRKYETIPARHFGEVGCWMSHLGAWSYMVDEKIDRMAVVEDDALVTPASVNDIIEQSDGYGLYMAGEWAEFYVISLSAAETLVHAAYEYGFKRMPVDEYMFDMIREGAVTGQFWTGHIVQARHFPSNIHMKGIEH